MAQWKKMLTKYPLEGDLAVSAADGKVLTATATGSGNPAWETIPTQEQTMGDGFVVSADTVTTATTIVEGETLTIAGGTGVSTDVSSDGVVTISAGNAATEAIEDICGAMFTGNTETGITVTYQDSTADIDLVVADTTITGDSGSTGITPGDTLTIVGAGGVSTAMSGDTLTITGSLADESVEDIVGAMFTGNTETGITVTYQDGTADIDLVVADTTVAGDTGSTGMTPGDTLTIAGGTNCTTAMSGDTLTVNATTQTQTMGAGFTATATTSGTNSTITAGDTLTIAAGTGITTTATSDGTITIASTVSNSDVDVNVANLTARLPQVTESVTIGDATDVTVTMAGDLTVTGDLQVSGATITTSTETLEINDNKLVLNKDYGGSSVASTGIVIERGSSLNNWSLFAGSGGWYLGQEGSGTGFTQNYSLPSLYQSASSDASGTPEYGVGSIWYNRTSGGMWMNVSDTPGGG